MASFRWQGIQFNSTQSARKPLRIRWYGLVHARFRRRAKKIYKTSNASTSRRHSLSLHPRSQVPRPLSGRPLLSTPHLYFLYLSQVAIRTLGKFFDRLTIKSDHRLVREGIYRRVRHPIYTSYILLFLGFVALLQSLLGLILPLATCVLWFGNRMAIEEKMLEEEFGEEYRSYCRESKRLYPFIY
ncbi:MAG: isoprenylcysteine carboxylmethyltransferase family protein [Pseudomonadota bacterium]